jgi:WhiB family redox-sensing transcriptional regulator
MSTTCPRCGGVWTITLNPGTVHYAWHDDELCCRCRGLLEVEVAAELAELAAAAAAAPRPAREGIPWSPEERVRHINVALELSAPSVPQGDWIADALCAQVDGELFFPEKGGDARAAKAVCGNCPVTAPCLDWALTTRQRNGVYGGLSDRERLALQREQAS